MKTLFEISTNIPSKSLIDSFVVPPFSTLDTRLGYWQDRKKMWNKYIGDSSESRNDDYGRTYNFDKPSYNGIKTSLFDPVLAELMYKWFCIPNGKVLDPFGGEQTKGVVAGLLGLDYTGIEIRQEQVDINNKATSNLENVNYICGNSAHMDVITEFQNFSSHNYQCDMIFTSPPYYDLEVYSDYDSSSKQTYKEFMIDMKFSYRWAIEWLKPNSFFVIKVGELRDKNGAYLGFVPDTIKQLQDLGLQYYNEIILINQSGSGALRAAGNMKSRKVVKTHQNVLVFYKGDISKIKDKFEALRL